MLISLFLLEWAFLFVYLRYGNGAKINATKKMKAHKKFHEELLAKGFTHDDEDPQFPYSLDLTAPLEDGEVTDEDEKIYLLFGLSQLNCGDFHISVAGRGILTFDVDTIDEALEFASKITGFEPLE